MTTTVTETQVVVVSESQVNVITAGIAGADGQGVAAGGTSGQILAKASDDDYDTQWINASGTGTVTSVSMTVPTGLSVFGSPITTSGTLAVSLSSGYVIPQQSTIDSFITSSAVAAGYQPLASVLTNTTASFTTAQESKLSGIASGAEVNVNGDWNASSGDAQILNKPTLGTAAAQDVGYFATTAQGALADSALQSGDNISELTNNSGYITSSALSPYLTSATAASTYVPLTRTINGAALSSDITLDTDDISEGSTNLYFTNERVDDRVASLLVAGTNITLTYNDGAGTLTIDSSGGGGGGAPTGAQYVTLSTNGSLTHERVLTAGTGISITDGGAGSTVTINSTITQYTDEMAQDAVGGIFVDSSEIDFTYSDGTPSITASLVAGSIDESKLDASVNASLDLADSAVQPGTLASYVPYTGASSSVNLGTNSLTVGGTFINGGTLSGASATDNFLNLTATMPSTMTAATNAVSMNITSAGSSTFNNRALSIDYLAGYTGSSLTVGALIVNRAAGTGATFGNGSSTLNYRPGNSNLGAQLQANGTTTGFNFGGYGSAFGSSVANYGAFNSAASSLNTPALNVGTFSAAYSATTNVAGAFMLKNSGTPSFSSCALLADNGDQAVPVAIFRDNGSAVVTIADGGNVTCTGNVSVADDAYASGWNGSTNVPTKNAVYDKINSMFTGTANIAVGTTAPASPAVGDLWVDTSP